MQSIGSRSALRLAAASSALAASVMSSRVCRDGLRQPPACVAAPLLVAMRFSGCVGSQYGASDATAGSDAPARKVTHYSKLGMDGFTDVRFNTTADAFLENVENVLDGLEHAEVEEISCNGGVLTLETTSSGTFIINKQAPNLQLWLSSPVSGPHHYDMVITKDEASGEEVTQWLSDHDGHSLRTKLEQELSDILRTPIEL